MIFTQQTCSSSIHLLGYFILSQVIVSWYMVTLVDRMDDILIRIGASMTFLSFVLSLWANCTTGYIYTDTSVQATSQEETVGLWSRCYDGNCQRWGPYRFHISPKSRVEVSPWKLSRKSELVRLKLGFFDQKCVVVFSQILPRTPTYLDQFFKFCINLSLKFFRLIYIMISGLKKLI